MYNQNNEKPKSEVNLNNIVNEGETYEEARLRISKENGYLNGYLPDKYQSYNESEENPLYFDRDIEQKDLETQRRLNKIVHDPLEESIDNSLARQFDDLYTEKAAKERQRLCNRFNHIRFDIENWEDFMALNTYTSKLDENYVPQKVTEKQRVDEDNIYFGVYPVQHKRRGDEPPFDKSKISQETPFRFLGDFGLEYDKGIMRGQEPPFNHCNCWKSKASKPKIEQPLPYLYASRIIKSNEMKDNFYISPNLKRLLDQDYRNTGKIGSGSSSGNQSQNQNTHHQESPAKPSHPPSKSNSIENSKCPSPSPSTPSLSTSLSQPGNKSSGKNKNKIQFHSNSFIEKDDLHDLIINSNTPDGSTKNYPKFLAPIKAPKRITCRDRSHNYVIYDYETIRAKTLRNNRIKNLASKQKIYNSSLNVLS